jgi:hypothetical protein
MGLKELQSIKQNATVIKPKKVYYLPKQSKKMIAALEAQKKAGGNVEKKSLNEWFLDIQERHFDMNGGTCMECGAFIPVDYARHATAHLLPKKTFKSVATHELNYLILGAGCGCHVKTDRIDKFEKMKVWLEAARRIKEMLPLLPFDELKYVSSQLLTALDKT